MHAYHFVCVRRVFSSVVCVGSVVPFDVSELSEV